MSSKYIRRRRHRKGYLRSAENPMSLQNQHAISIAVKSVACFHGVLVSAKHQFLFRKCRDQHEQRRLRKMEVGQESTDNLEREARNNEQACFAPAGSDAPAMFPRHTFERSDTRCPHGDHAPALIESTVDG